MQGRFAVFEVLRQDHKRTSPIGNIGLARGQCCAVSPSWVPIRAATFAPSPLHPLIAVFQSLIIEQCRLSLAADLLSLA